VTICITPDIHTDSVNNSNNTLPNWELQRRLARLVLNPPEATAFPPPQAQQLIDIARRKQVLAPLALRYSEGRVAAKVFNVDQAEMLNEALLRNTRDKMKMMAQALKIAASLNSAGIKPVFLKGTARMLAGSTDALGFREQADIDLLVGPDDRTKASETLIKEGYQFSIADPRSGGQVLSSDPARAERVSQAHHHLPGMINGSYGAVVELHRHHLPRRFQARNSLQALLDGCIEYEQRGVQFLVPNPTHQLIHLINGTYINDGYYDRHDFPIRTGHDFLEIMQQRDREQLTLDRQMLERCGEPLPIFTALVKTLGSIDSDFTELKAANIERLLDVMERRANDDRFAARLDRQARLKHLGYAFLYSWGKLPAYLMRSAREKDLLR
jgi:Uncharacterised nucleotidyltransferase